MPQVERFLAALLDLFRPRPARRPQAAAATPIPDDEQAVAQYDAADNGSVADYTDIAPGFSLLRTIQHSGIVVAADVRTDRGIALSADDETVLIWEISSGELLRSLRMEAAPIRSACFSSDGSYVACGGFAGQVTVWDTEKAERLWQLDDFCAAPVNSVSFSADGANVLAAAGDGSIGVWNLADLDRVFSMRQSYAVSQAHLIERERCILADHGRHLRLWCLESGACLRQYEGHTGEIRAVALSADATHALSAAEDNTLRLWDLASGLCRHVLLGHEHWVLAAAFSPDGRLAVSGGRDQTIRIWDLSDGRCLHVIPAHEESIRQIAFGADGRTVVSGANDMTARLWNLAEHRAA